MTLDQVLAAHDKAISADKWTTLIEEGQLVKYGVKGTYRQIFANDDYRQTERLGALTMQWGSLNGQDWYQNENGIVMMEHDTHQANEVAMDALAHHTRDNDEGLTLAGESATPAAYVVEVHPQGGRHEWRYYDKKTFRLVRVESVYPTKRLIWTYDDFRTVKGITSAWHAHLSDGYPQNDLDYVTTSQRYDLQIAGSDLAIPDSNADFVQFPAGAQMVTLPAKIIDGRVIVRVTIGGRGYDLQLDSGSSSITIDSGVAKQLGLTTFGESVQSAGGTFSQKQAIIPELRVGDVVMKNVVVDTFDYSDQQDVSTRVIGLLGFDFIANVMLKINYDKGTVEAMPALLFTPPADGFAVDALWDDGVPRVPVTIGDTPAHFIIDTGADNGIIFSQFAIAHPNAINDRNGYSNIMASGVGGTFSLRPTQVKSLTLGGINYQDFTMYEVVNNPGFEDEDYDGLLGHDFLRYFTVYFDYKDAHIYLVRNSIGR